MKITMRGYTFDTRTAAMIRWAERKAGFRFTIKQGSYHTGVGASAGTHDGGGAVDFASPADHERRAIMLRALKDAGFAAWHRDTKPDVWGEHIHCVAIGCTDLAPVAARQVESFDAHKDGLVSNHDDPTYHPQPKRKFSLPLNRPIVRK